MLDLYEYIINKINNMIGIKPYTDFIPSSAAYPRIQLQFGNGLPYGHGELNLMQIDIWDKNHSKAQVEAIADSIDKIFKRHNETTNDFCVQIYRNNPYRLNVPDPDMEIRRRQLRYVIKIYRKE